jgi:hypothetical protein
VLVVEPHQFSRIRDTRQQGSWYSLGYCLCHWKYIEGRFGKFRIEILSTLILSRVCLTTRYPLSLLLELLNVYKVSYSLQAGNPKRLQMSCRHDFLLTARRRLHISGNSIDNEGWTPSEGSYTRPGSETFNVRRDPRWPRRQISERCADCTLCIFNQP